MHDFDAPAGLLSFDAMIDGRAYAVDVGTLPSGTLEATAWLPGGTMGLQVYVAPEQVTSDGGDLRTACARALAKEAHWYAASLDTEYACAWG